MPPQFIGSARTRGAGGAAPKRNDRRGVALQIPSEIGDTLGMRHLHRAILAGVILSPSMACSSAQERPRTDAGLPIVHLEALPRKHEIELTLRTRDHELTVFQRNGARRFMVSGQTRSLDTERFARAFPELYAVYRAAISEQGVLLHDAMHPPAPRCAAARRAV